MQKSVLAWLLSVLGLVALTVYVGPTLLKVVPNSGPAQQGEAAIGGAFTLTDSNGKTVKDTDFRGKYMLVYFGFTHCPDICPTTLLMMTNALEQLGRDGKNIVPIFVTLDPERDTQAAVGAYVKNFSPDLIGLTGTKEQITKVADTYKVYFSKVKSEDSAMGYMIDHSGFIYLMDKDGKYVAHYTHTMPLQSLVSGLRSHVL